MAAQFGDTLLNVGLQHVQQAVYADLLQVGLPTPLTIELRQVTDRAVLAQGHSVLPRHVEEMRKQPRVPMHVVVRVEMCRWASHQFLKAAALAVVFQAPAVGEGSNQVRVPPTMLKMG